MIIAYYMKLIVMKMCKVANVKHVGFWDFALHPSGGTYSTLPQTPCWQGVASSQIKPCYKNCFIKTDLTIVNICASTSDVIISEYLLLCTHLTILFYFFVFCRKLNWLEEKMKSLALASEVAPKVLWGILWILMMRASLFQKWDLQTVTCILHVHVIAHVNTCHLVSR